MDFGQTDAKGNRTLHFCTGFVVLCVGYSGALLVLRYFVG